MSSNTVISTTNLKSRRDKIKSKQRWENFVSFNRSLMILSLTVGVFWVLTLPHWVIRDSKQINLQGNDLLTDDELRSLIPLKYPQSLLKLSTSQLTEDLQKKVPLANIIVTRELFPPSLTIKVTEKKPVAIALASVVSPKTKKLELKRIGYVDKDGIFVDNEVYKQLQKKSDQLPSLKVLGTPQIYLSYWQDLYDLISQSNVKITEIDWQNPTNLILTTELGKVHIGAYNSKFPQQLMALEKLKSITTKIPRERIIYIDLTDVEIPSIKEKKPPKEVKKDS
ncbi:MAG: FtsQ-type POTRA domain-containing protein [Cyanobacteria bacterium]|nr:FtsQ-type POTRA domain-containing protein [Cyanobacteria bacterium CG_2015-16_32_12]NCO77845.1 FtsQ-type POTRA domain-containing protein [Cyanobacteria bacterium CG_2015-22_32_23]NCQ03386.1 FtsQ-type POTRA domain-containing protein [Cyanobacteria bacterium CG_2015-09_32_10]NCQ42186.1 FtsQ-type POTRA domain-containing protein [Cyanobacteria bacterium CG_2015-04_32_10]NCS84271.1 FtsQ-type POTRA domain-containing protein [Cyanobacteria bacterium CG_2015-02_32_10]